MTSEPKIRLDRVGKTYSGSSVAAVEELSLEVQEGEILVLVGPSGCGKSTTLRLINRMIEPSSGRIYLDGEDVTDVNADQLRRRIGYVIQQIGLFPHQTIGQNIATVPKMLGWDKKRTATQVDHLLDMVGLEPNQYRDRYPKELSGGQAQRVGVARALGADPSIMLMDEPFGAIDPITRENLQGEFLRLQEELGKTIVFVTHDIDEAIKMGDRIAILGERSRIRQCDTPEHILALPADDFVNDFIGAGSTLKGLTFEQVGDLDLTVYPQMKVSDAPEVGLRALANSEQDWILVVDDSGRPSRWLQEDDLRSAKGDYANSGQDADATVETDANLYDSLEEMLQTSTGLCVVVDDDGGVEGVVDMGQVSDAIRAAQEEAQRHYDELEVKP